MSISCHSCGLSEFRTSRFRLSDLLHLLILRYPVRCHACHERSFGPLLAVLRLARVPHQPMHATRS